MIATGLAAGLLGLVLGLLAWLGFRRAQGASRPLRWLTTAIAAVFGILAVPPMGLGLYLAGRLAAGQPGEDFRSLAAGVSYRRLVGQAPRRVVMHVVVIDRDRIARLVVPSPGETGGVLGPRSRADLPTTLLADLGADLGINASYFTPCLETHPLSYAPRVGEPATVLGPAIGEGRRHGWAEAGVDWVPLWHAPGRRIGIGEPVPDDADACVSAPGWLVHQGQNVAPTQPSRFDPNGLKPYPRTAVGFDSLGRLHLVVVDGKQPRYSLGLTLPELADGLIALGVTDAVALDGGGSSTLVGREPPPPDGRLVVLNRPCHTKVPGRQRPVANVLGVRLTRP
jgi:hypothetical protein